MSALPLAAGLIVATAKADPLLRSACTFHLGVTREPVVAAAEKLRTADVVALSVYCWNERYSLAVAARIKEENPSCLVVLGGPSAPRDSEDIAAFFTAHAAVDMLVLGEGEVTFGAILHSIVAGGDASTVAGTATRGLGSRGVRYGETRPRLTDFSVTASPYLDGTFDTLLQTLPTPHAALCETNRGCPFACTFCDWGQATRSKVHELPLARIKDELDWIAARQIPYLYIVDANFGIRPRDIAITQEIAATHAQTGYPQYVYFHLTKNAQQRNLATVRTLLEAGIGCQVALSMQDFTPRVLEAVKRSNISRDKSLALRRTCNNEGIPTFNELLLGLPEQRYEDFCNSVIDALTPFPGDSFYLYLCRLLPNTELASSGDRQRYGLEGRHCLATLTGEQRSHTHVDEFEEIVVATSAMPPDDWQRAYRFGYLVSVATNLKLFDVVVAWLRDIAKVSLQAFFDALIDAIETAASGTVFGRCRETFERYTASAMAGGALNLRLDGFGDRRWAIEEALLLTAMETGDAFFAELRIVVGRVCQTCAEEVSAAELDELLAYQSLISASFDKKGAASQVFNRDWLAFERAIPDGKGARAPLQSTQLRYVPNPMLVAATDMGSFATTHLALLHGKSGYRDVRVQRTP
ncbi:MAG: radical SAM protein [Myxococcales bacterium]|nr:radical SAM protein [Myxococcales bacterium]